MQDAGSKRTLASCILHLESSGPYQIGKIRDKFFAMRKLYSILLLLIFSLPLFADEADDFILAQMQKYKIPGLALLVVQKGQIVKEKGYGFANLELQVPVKPETIFQSGSVGKQFTATAVMMLVEEGKIGLDDPLTKYFPDAPSTWNNIKVRNLLTHTSGLGDYPDDFDFRKDLTEDQELQIVYKTPLNFQPGEKYSYSNLAYLTLGILIHKVSGEFYGDFLQQRVFQPLGMTTTRIINEADIIPNRAAGYELVNGEVKNQKWVAPSLNTTADGSLYFSIVDLQKWDDALYAEKLLKKSSFDQMWTSMKLNDGSSTGYGFGWDVEDINGHRLLEHGGSWQGFRTAIVRFVDDQLSVVVLTNLDTASPEYIAHMVAGFYLPAIAPEKHTAIALSEIALKPYEGEYQTEAGSTIKITAENGKLIVTGSDESRRTVLIPYGENSFFQEDSERTARFEKDNQGKVTYLVWLSDGEETKVKRKSNP